MLYPPQQSPWLWHLSPWDYPNVLVVFKAWQPPDSPILASRGRWPACCLPPTAHPHAFPRVAFVGFACQRAMSHSESPPPQGGCGLWPDLRSSRICSGWEQDMWSGERAPHLLCSGGFLQVGRATYQHTHESQAIPWSTHPKTGSKIFPTFMGEACSPFIPRAGRRFQAANVRANFVLLL